MSELILKDKVALITGASRGIGAAVARRYASLGAHLILISRKTKDLETVDDMIQNDGNPPATLVELDLRKLEKIDQLTLSIAQRFGKLDILVGNAATLGELAPVTSISTKLWEQTMTTNVTANYCLLRNFDPLLKKSDAGRAIFVTSGITSSFHPFWSAYAASKSALEALVKTYAAEVKNSNIRANLIDPGRVNTQMRAIAYPGEDKNKLATPESVAQSFVDLAMPQCSHNGDIIKAQRS